MKCFILGDEAKLKELLQQAWRFGYNVREINNDLDKLKKWVQENHPRRESSKYNNADVNQLSKPRDFKINTYKDPETNNEYMSLTAICTYQGDNIEITIPKILLSSMEINRVCENGVNALKISFDVKTNVNNGGEYVVMKNLDWKSNEVKNND